MRRDRTLFHAAAFAVVLALGGPGRATPVAGGPVLPAGLKMLATTRARPDGADQFAIVAAAFPGESRNAARDRPLLVYRLRAGRWVLVGRNDHVVLRADEGGQCDPFEYGRIVAKGRYFTVENGVGCGITHLSDLVTFRFDPASRRYVFDNWRTESLVPNPSRNPDAEALVSTGVKVTRARRPAIYFERWRRPSE
jgi:hypothetical protein